MIENLSIPDFFGLLNFIQSSFGFKEIYLSREGLFFQARISYGVQEGDGILFKFSQDNLVLIQKEKGESWIEIEHTNYNDFLQQILIILNADISKYTALRYPGFKISLPELIEVLNAYSLLTSKQVLVSKSAGFYGLNALSVATEHFTIDAERSRILATPVNPFFFGNTCSFESKIGKLDLRQRSRAELLRLLIGGEL